MQPLCQDLINRLEPKLKLRPEALMAVLPPIASGIGVDSLSERLKPSELTAILKHAIGWLKQDGPEGGSAWIEHLIVASQTITSNILLKQGAPDVSPGWIERLIASGKITSKRFDKKDTKLARTFYIERAGQGDLQLILETGSKCQPKGKGYAKYPDKDRRILGDGTFKKGKIAYRIDNIAASQEFVSLKTVVTPGEYEQLLREVTMNNWVSMRTKHVLPQSLSLAYKYRKVSPRAKPNEKPIDQWKACVHARFVSRLKGREREKPLDFLIDQIIEIFSDLHKVDVVYQDLKPENLLLSDNLLYLIDFANAQVPGGHIRSALSSYTYESPEVLDYYLNDSTAASHLSAFYKKENTALAFDGKEAGRSLASMFLKFFPGEISAIRCELQGKAHKANDVWSVGVLMTEWLINKNFYTPRRKPDNTVGDYFLKELFVQYPEKLTPYLPTFSDFVKKFLEHFIPDAYAHKEGMIELLMGCLEPVRSKRLTMEAVLAKRKEMLQPRRLSRTPAARASSKEKFIGLHVDCSIRVDGVSPPLDSGIVADVNTTTMIPSPGVTKGAYERHSTGDLEPSRKYPMRRQGASASLLPPSVTASPPVTASFDLSKRQSEGDSGVTNTQKKILLIPAKPPRHSVI